MMKQYLLSIYQPDGEAPPPAALAPVMRRLKTWNEELRAAGAWVFSTGLYDAASSTVVQMRDGDVLTTDGPYLEGKEHMGGFTLIQAEDLDEALHWAEGMARAITIDGSPTGLAIEVRPVRDVPGTDGVPR
jgi:hypothetical protein